MFMNLVCTISVLVSIGFFQVATVPTEIETVRLKGRIAASVRSSLVGAPLKVHPPYPGWELGMVSWVARDRKGLIYLLQRGEKAEPVVVLSAAGEYLRGWGKGMYTMPHSIRIDEAGNVWTTDAASSMVYKFSPQGSKLLEISVGGQPSPCNNNFCGVTDVAFGPAGRVFITDGYANARVLEYTADGKKVREWGARGVKPGQFNLPHSIVIDEGNIIYVADRENGRIEKFSLEGKFLGQLMGTGKTFSLALAGGKLYAGAQPRNLPNGSPGWILELDRNSGKILSYVESTRNHGIAISADGWLVGPGADGPWAFRTKAVSLAK